MRSRRLFPTFTLAALLAAPPSRAQVQQPEPQTRQAVIEQAQAEKLKTLHPYIPTKGEQLMGRLEKTFVYPTTTWHPFFESAYRGGGFAVGPGYMKHVTSYNYIDVRGSYSIAGYKRAEAEFVAPRLFRRRGSLSLLGGWRDATQVGFWGLGADSPSGNRANYGFEQPYASALLTVTPARRLLLFQGGFDASRWSLKSGVGRPPSVDRIYTAAELPGLDARPTYLHPRATMALDWRPSPGYARRGGYYGVTAHDYTDPDDRFGFRQVDYEIIQHIPILREAWVISLHGVARTTSTKGTQEIPFFMMPSLGGGSNMRAFSSWRFRDRNSLLLQAEWRIMVNRFLDTAVFYDAGKVAARRADLDFDQLKSDYGFGARFHTPLSTVFRIDVARSREGTRLIFATSPAF